MDVEDEKMSSLLETCEVEDNLSSTELTNSKNSNSSFKTSQDNDSAESASNQSIDISIIDQSTLLNIAFGQKKNTVSDENEISFHEVFDTSTKLACPIEPTSEDKLVTPLVAVGDNIDSSLLPNIKVEEVAEETSLQQIGSKTLDSTQGVDSVDGSGEATDKKVECNMSKPLEQNVDGPCQDATVIPVQSKKEACNVERLDGDKEVTSSGNESVKKLIPTPKSDVCCQEQSSKAKEVTALNETQASLGDETTLPPVVTILKPKAQYLETDRHEDVIFRAKSEDLSSSKRSVSVFITNFVSGRIDLGDNAELFEDLIYWRYPKQTGLLFVSVLLLMLSMQYYSLISVTAYLSLAVLSCGSLCRLYSTSHGTPNPILEFSPALSEENVRKITDLTAYYVNDTILALRRLYMVDDLGDSIKFALVLWYLTYVGLWFNGMTIIVISFVTIFTLPTIYEHNKEQIDGRLAVFWDKWLSLSARARTASQVSLARILSNEHQDKVK